MIDNLLSCPFCGKEATYDHFNHKHIIECANDECKVNPSVIGDSEEEVIQTWNKRFVPWHTGDPEENGYYVLECKIGNSKHTYCTIDYWSNEAKYWTVNNVIRWYKIESVEKKNEETPVQT